MNSRYGTTRNGLDAAIAFKRKFITKRVGYTLAIAPVNGKCLVWLELCIFLRTFMSCVKSILNGKSKNLFKSPNSLGMKDFLQPHWINDVRVSGKNKVGSN